MADVIARVNRQDGGLWGYAFKCPGCKDEHHIPTVGEKAWGFNGSLDAPTFTPSILVRGFVPITDEDRDRIMAGEDVHRRPFCCHSFVTDGRIQFLGDCTHALAGQTVKLQPVAVSPSE